MAPKRCAKVTAWSVALVVNTSTCHCDQLPLADRLHSSLGVGDARAGSADASRAARAVLSDRPRGRPCKPALTAKASRRDRPSSTRHDRSHPRVKGIQVRQDWTCVVVRGYRAVRYFASRYRNRWS